MVVMMFDVNWSYLGDNLVVVSLSAVLMSFAGTWFIKKIFGKGFGLSVVFFGFIALFLLKYSFDPILRGSCPNWDLYGSIILIIIGSFGYLKAIGRFVGAAFVFCCWSGLFMLISSPFIPIQEESAFFIRVEQVEEQAREAIQAYPTLRNKIEQSSDRMYDLWSLLSKKY